MPGGGDKSRASRKARRSSRQKNPGKQRAEDVGKDAGEDDQEKGYGGVFKPYSGDLFGTRAHNPAGMIYLSRMKTDPYTGKAQKEAEQARKGEVEHHNFPGKMRSHDLTTHF
jgi:hypothetical protein